MQMPVLRAVAMTAVGNAALAGKDVSAFSKSGLWRFNKSVKFVLPRGGLADDQVARDPVAWFAWLAANGCRGLRLHTAPMEQQPGRLNHINERMLVGFVGGGPRWLIEAVEQGASKLWESFDRIGDRNEADHRIWLTTFARLAETAPQDLADANVVAARAELETALADISALAHKFESGPFSRIFDESLTVLRGGELTPASIDFIDLTELDDEARRVLVVCQEAWVFGGMGSWNDTGPGSDLNEDYERTSEALFQALVRGLTAVANSSYRSA